MMADGGKSESRSHGVLTFLFVPTTAAIEGRGGESAGPRTVLHDPMRKLSDQAAEAETGFWASSRCCICTTDIGLPK